MRARGVLKLGEMISTNKLCNCKNAVDITK